MNIVLDRIQQQQRNINFQSQVENFAQEVQTAQKVEPISPEELQTTLANLFQVEPEIKPVEVVETLNFPDLFHWVEFYLKNENSFNDKQKQPLSTLVQARDLINVGCACRRTQRLNAANDYFRTFWVNNSKNDLITTVLNAAKVQSVSFGDFLVFP